MARLNENETDAVSEVLQWGAAALFAGVVVLLTLVYGC